MYEVLLEFLLLLGELLLEVLAGGGLELLGSRRHRSRSRPIRTLEFIRTLLLLLILGGIIGLLGTVVVPRRVLPLSGVPGLSLVLGPLAAGAVMHGLGEWRRSRHHTPSLVASFWGGALFAFGMAVARFSALE